MYSLSDWATMKYREKILANAEDEDGIEFVRISEIQPHYYEYNIQHRFYIVRHHVMDNDKYCWEKVTSDFRTALRIFGKEAIAKYRWSDGREEKKYGMPEYTDDWRDYLEELLPAERFTEEKDYGPGNPWDAPGMKISDFIRGVY